MSVAGTWETVTRPADSRLPKQHHHSKPVFRESLFLHLKSLTFSRISEVWKVVFFLVYGKEARGLNWLSD